jgi:mRNA-degrading endonuclease RelE of RelBE toxin-antitoxin system
MKKDWQKLTYDQQKVFKNKAEYLLERGYIQGKTTEELAKEIYKNS